MFNNPIKPDGSAEKFDSSELINAGKFDQLMEELIKHNRYEVLSNILVKAKEDQQLSMVKAFMKAGGFHYDDLIANTQKENLQKIANLVFFMMDKRSLHYAFMFVFSPIMHRESLAVDDKIEIAKIAIKFTHRFGPVQHNIINSFNSEDIKNTLEEFRKLTKQEMVFTIASPPSEPLSDEQWSTLLKENKFDEIITYLFYTENDKPLPNPVYEQIDNVIKNLVEKRCYYTLSSIIANSKPNQQKNIFHAIQKSIPSFQDKKYGRNFHGDRNVHHFYQLIGVIFENAELEKLSTIANILFSELKDASMWHGISAGAFPIIMSRNDINRESQVAIAKLAIQYLSGEDEHVSAIIEQSPVNIKKELVKFTKTIPLHKAEKGTAVQQSTISDKPGALHSSSSGSEQRHAPVGRPNFSR